MNKGAWYVLLSGVMWGALSIFWKQLGWMDPVYVLFSRIVWSLVFGGAVLLAQGRMRETLALLRDRKIKWTLIAAGVVIACNWCLYIYAISIGQIMQASLAYYISPILSIVLAALVFREKLNPLQWLAAGIASAGVLISIFYYGEVPFLALAMGASFSVYGMIKKAVAQIRGEASAFLELLYIAPVAVIGLIVWEAQGKGIFGIQPDWRMILLPLTGVATGVPLMLFAHGLETAPLSLSGILNFANPTLQLVLSVLLFGEAFTKASLITFVLVWVALILFVVGNMAKNRKALSLTEESAA